jgi:hypothetical protein
MATVRMKGLGKLKNPATSLRIEPVTMRLVAQGFNNNATRSEVLIPLNIVIINLLIVALYRLTEDIRV